MHCAVHMFHQHCPERSDVTAASAVDLSNNFAYVIVHCMSTFDLWEALLLYWPVWNGALNTACYAEIRNGLAVFCRVDGLYPHAYLSITRPYRRLIRP